MTHFPALPPARLGYADNAIDRASHLRDNADWLKDAANSPQARFYAFCGETPVLGTRASEGGFRPGDPLALLSAQGLEATGGQADPLFARAEVSLFGPPLDEVFLGLIGETPLFALRFPDVLINDLQSLPTYLITDLRSIAMQGLVDEAQFGPLAQAKSILFWHQRHGFCANCGAKSQAKQAGWRRDCPSCNTQHFPRTDPVVIMLAVDGNHCLMGRQDRFPPGMYSALAGFMEPGETIADAVRREVFEEAGIKTGAVRYLFDQPWPFPASLMIGCLADATSTAITVDGNELQDARWFSKEDCYAMLTRAHPDRLFCPPPMAIAHHLIRAFIES